MTTLLQARRRTQANPAIPPGPIPAPLHRANPAMEDTDLEAEDPEVEAIQGTLRAELPYRPGNRDDFDRLYRDSYPRIVRTLVGVLGHVDRAEECAQDAFLKAFQAWGRWRADVPAEVWLHRIAINTAISQIRRDKVRSLTWLMTRVGPPPPGQDPGERAELNRVLAGLSRLPPKEAAAVVLRYYHGYTNRDIAAAVGVSERTVGARIAAGLARLRSSLES